MTAAGTQTGTDLVIARTESVTRTFGGGRTEVRALRGVTLSVSRGELVALRGRSGSGKSTLLSIIGGLDQPTSGRVEVAGQDVTAMDADGRARLLRDTVAFIFQAFGLIPILSAAENVGLPMRLARTDPAVREQRAAALLDLVGLGGRVGLRPYELSGGEQQRVAIARALANEPQLLLADEPTGQLDSDTGGQIMRLLRSIVHAEGITAIVATHDPVLIGLADRVLSLKDGELVEQDGNRNSRLACCVCGSSDLASMNVWGGASRDSRDGRRRPPSGCHAGGSGGVVPPRATQRRPPEEITRTFRVGCAGRRHAARASGSRSRAPIRW